MRVETIKLPLLLRPLLGVAMGIAMLLVALVMVISAAMISVTAILMPIITIFVPVKVKYK